MPTANQQATSPAVVPQRAYSPEDLPRLKREYAENGYLIFRNVVPRDKLAELNTRLHEEFQRAKGSGVLFSGGGNLTGHLNCFPGAESRFAYDAVVAAGIVDLIREFFPTATRLPNVGLNFNLPNSIAQHYHADRPFRRDFMICNVAVVDTEIANGAIDVLPGTHQKFYPFWKFVLERASKRTTRLPMRQGDVLIRTSNLWHRGMPNMTSVPRPMLAFTWEDGGSAQPDPFQIDAGKITFKPNWYRPTMLGRLRERTFMAAPITYDAYRFVDSVLTKKGYE
jgi:ectoine hydroxylase-related dioxygenase (phytanoyl-CoA dioxygenase family)